MEDKLYYYKFVLTRVIDGDTVVGNIDLGFNFILQNQNLRLLYIDTPEVRGADKVQGLIAKEFLIDLISDRNIIIHSFNKDSFGRVLAELFIEKTDGWISANAVLLNEGLALPYI